MLKVEYVGPRVEVSNHGVFYRRSKEDKYLYLGAALEILKNIDNDYSQKSSYSRNVDNIDFEEENLHKTLQYYDNAFETSIREEYKKYSDKIEHQIQYIKSMSSLTDMDKQVWIKNIELMKGYKVKRAVNKIYYMHCIQNIVCIIMDKKIKQITVPFNKNFFHVLNTIKGRLITGKPSIDASVIQGYDDNGMMIIRLMLK
ncbi:MAG: hypothetical protein U9O64_06050 [Campylobacterota bacterium]|nr:hypothetical protein [Campylobacterota bacterium]